MPILRNTGYALVLGVVHAIDNGLQQDWDLRSDLKNCINDHCKAFPTCIWS